MNQLFKITRTTLLCLLAVAFFSSISIFLYLSIPTSFYDGWQIIVISSLFLALAFWLIYKNYLIGAVLPFFLTYKAFPDAYRMTSSDFVWLLSHGPTILTSYALSIMIAVACALYIVLWLVIKKNSKHGKAL